jgi:hypothetical protein
MTRYKSISYVVVLNNLSKDIKLFSIAVAPYIIRYVISGTTVINKRIFKVL